MAVPIRTHPVKASKRRQTRFRFPRIPRRHLIIGACALCIGVAVWAIGWSPLLRITGITIDGAKTLTESDIRAVVGSVTTLPRTDAMGIGESLIAAYPVIASVSVQRDWPHTLRIVLTERTAAGIWCRSDHCRLFDRSGVRWGTALPSRGTLLMSVRDERSDDVIAPELLQGLCDAYDQLPLYGLRAMLMTLPDEAPGDLVITTDAPFTLVVDALGNVPEQLDTLGILLAQEASNDAFRPSVIDLRTPGRIFYR